MKQFPEQVTKELEELRETKTIEFASHKYKVCEAVYIYEDVHMVSRWDIYNTFLMTDLLSHVKNEEIKVKINSAIDACKESL